MCEYVVDAAFHRDIPRMVLAVVIPADDRMRKFVGIYMREFIQTAKYAVS